MCLQRVSDLKDNLGNRLQLVDFIDQDKDNCDYFDVMDNSFHLDDINGFMVLQLNIHGLINKQSDLLKLVNKIAGKSKIDVIMLQETWLTKTNCNLVNIPGYKHIFQHRTSCNGGGVSLLINQELTSRRCHSLCCDEPFLECCTVEIKLHNFKLIVSSVYQPPNTKESQFTSMFDRIMKSIYNSSNYSLIGLDHNLDLLKSNIHKPTQSFLESVLSKSYVPCITRPTWITKSSATLIDNILVSRDIYNNITCGIAISDLSDHFPCIMTCPPMTNSNKGSVLIRKKNLDDKNYAKIAHDLNINWSFVEEPQSLNDNYQLFHKTLLGVINKYIEEKTIEVPYKWLIREPWLTKGIIK